VSFGLICGIRWDTMKVGEPYSKEDFDAAVQFKIRFEKVQGALPVHGTCRWALEELGVEFDVNNTTSKEAYKILTRELGEDGIRCAYSYVFVVHFVMYSSPMAKCQSVTMICWLIIARRQLSFYTLLVHFLAAANR
jgi:hypothetical protein